MTTSLNRRRFLRQAAAGAAAAGIGGGQGNVGK